jgi:hypothetical protein
MENEEKKPSDEALLEEIAATLKTIKEWVSFLGVVVALSLLAGFLYGLFKIISVKGGP